MARQRATQPKYMVNVYDDPDFIGSLRLTFVPRRTRRAPYEGELTQEEPQYYVASVQGHGDDTEFNWIRSPAQHETQLDLEEIARHRATARHEWLEKLKSLVATVRRWADELDWATRAVEKKMEDAEIGNYSAPALLIQHETVRLFLEPVARVAPDTEGIVDLYLMPSYDDIASLYYYNHRWNVHYVFKEEPAVVKMREAVAKPLTKVTLRKVLEEMKAHAG